MIDDEDKKQRLGFKNIMKNKEKEEEQDEENSNDNQLKQLF